MDAHEYTAMAQVEATHWWYVGMRALAAALTDDLPPPQLLLDAGCGTGGALDHTQARCAYGFDYSMDALAHAAQHHAVFRADIQAIPVRDACVDLVTCSDVLYHRAVINDRVAIQELARVTTPGGFLLLRVPAHEWLRGSHDDRVHTQRRYTQASLTQLCTDAGLVVRRITAVNCLLMPLYLLLQILEAPDPTAQPTSVLRQPSRIEQWIGSRALATEAWLVRIGYTLPYGVSLMCLAQRPALSHATETE